jgi:hypothetical protein
MNMTGKRFQVLVQEAFNPFLIELGFTPDKPQLSGRYYRVKFIGDSHTLIVSLEPADAFFSIMLVRNDNYDLSTIDDPKKTPRLSDLNRMYMSEVTPDERATNESFFSAIKVEGQKERELLKCAKDLRLVLPRYLKG